MVHAKYNTFTVLCNYLHMLDFLIASVHLFFYILFQPYPPPKLKILKLSWLMGGQKKYSTLGVCVCVCVCVYIYLPTVCDCIYISILNEVNIHDVYAL